MMSLGIDQSFSCTGLVVVDENGAIECWETFKAEGKNETTLHTVKRADKIAEVILQLCTKYDISVVGIEGLSFGSVTNATRDLAMLQAIIVDRLLKAGYNPHVIAPTSLKKYATGKGNSKKEALFDCLPSDVSEIFGSVPKTKGRYDLTDAYWLARLAATL